MDVISGKVKNDHNPALCAEGLATAWSESLTNLFSQDMDTSNVAIKWQNDRTIFSGIFRAKIKRFVLFSLRMGFLDSWFRLI